METRKQRKTFTEEFKQQLVKLYENGKTKKAIAEEYDVSLTALNAWIRKVQKTGSTGRSAQEEEIRQLTKANKQLQMEVDILKQAALIMARKSGS